VAAQLMLEDGDGIVDTVSGRDFAVYLTARGKLLKCGELPRSVAFDTFRLRRTVSRAHAVGAQLKRLSMRERQAGHVCRATCCPVELPVRGKIRVQQVACGATHCAVLSEVDAANGMVRGLFSWGLGEYGQLGLGECQMAAKMTPVELSPELQLFLQDTDAALSATLRCGLFSTYLLRKGSSMLWHWGLLPSADHESHFVRQGVPVTFPLLDESSRIIDVAVGVEHVVLLSEDGSVFTWGHGGSGQLGLGPSTTSSVDCQKPMQVDFFRQEVDYRIVSISCGWNHTVAVSMNGRVYAWGSNDFGECGAASKFCEYYQPVLVSLPRPEELKLPSPGLRLRARCGGKSSAILLQRQINGSYCVERAFLCGVASASLGTLLPLEVLSLEKSQCMDCSMGWEGLVCLAPVEGVILISSQKAPPAWVIKEVTACTESRQGFEDGLPCLYTGVGAKIWVQVEAMTQIAMDAIAALPEKDGSMTNLFQVIVRQEKSASSSNKSGVSMLSMQRKRGNSEAVECSVVEILLVVQAKGRSVISFASELGEIVRNEFILDAIHPNEDKAESIAIPGEGHGNQDKAICVLGLRVEGISTESEQQVDKNWYKLRSNHVRVHSGDAVLLLIESATNGMEPAIQVEHRGNQWQYGLTHLDVVDNKCESRGLNLSVVELRFPKPGQYFIYDTKNQDDEEQDQRVPRLAVSSCMDSEERTQVLANLHDHLWAKYHSALAEAKPTAQFSSFLSSLLQHSVLKDAVVCSPWTSTSDVERSEPPFDFDREHNAQQVLLMHPDRPFILWGAYVGSSTGFDQAEQLTPVETSLPLRSILPPWAEAVSSKVAFRIATWLGKPTAASSSAESLQEMPIDYAKARMTAASAGLSVQQIPFDFLGSVSLTKQRAVCEALALVNPNIVGVHDSIVSWRRTNGDLFYTVQSTDLRVRRYGHESHEFPETAQSGRITRLKGQLSEFLWQAAEGKKIEELFQLLSSSKVTGGLQTRSNGGSKVIQLRGLVSHATSLGFDEVAAVLKQEWFALFRGIQALSPPGSTGITLSTLRTFLVDPFHQVRCTQVGGLSADFDPPIVCC